MIRLHFREKTDLFIQRIIGQWIEGVWKSLHTVLGQMAVWTQGICWFNQQPPSYCPLFTFAILWFLQQQIISWSCVSDYNNNILRPLSGHFIEIWEPMDLSWWSVTPVESYSSFLLGIEIFYQLNDLIKSVKSLQCWSLQCCLMFRSISN